MPSETSRRTWTVADSLAGQQGTIRPTQQSDHGRKNILLRLKSGFGWTVVATIYTQLYTVSYCVIYSIVPQPWFKLYPFSF